MDTFDFVDELNHMYLQNTLEVQQNATLEYIHLARQNMKIDTAKKTCKSQC